MRLITGAVVAVTALVGAAAAAADITRHASTARYSLTFIVTPWEAMYTPAEVRVKHPKRGQMVLSDLTTPHLPMSWRSRTRLLEIYVRSRATGKLLTNVVPAVAMADTTRSTPYIQQPGIVAMERIGRGSADLHYGEYLIRDKGAVFRVIATVNGKRATFTFRDI